VSRGAGLKGSALEMQNTRQSRGGKRAARHGFALAAEQAAGPKPSSLISEPIKLNTWSHVLSSHQQVTYPDMLTKTLRVRPHVMIVGSMVREMSGYPRSADVADPTQPYVMYPGTKYEHLMLPVTA
jgi:hypothetical protein